MFPFVEYLLLGLAAVALIMGTLVVSIVSRYRNALHDLASLDDTD